MITDWRQRDPDNWDAQLKAWNLVFIDDDDAEAEVTHTYTAEQFEARFAARLGKYPFIDKDPESSFFGYSYRINTDCAHCSSCRAYWIPGQEVGSV